MASYLYRDEAVIFDPMVEEKGRFDEYAKKLETVSLDDKCKFVMYKELSAPPA